MIQYQICNVEGVQGRHLYAFLALMVMDCFDDPRRVIVALAQRGYMQGPIAMGACQEAVKNRN